MVGPQTKFLIYRQDPKPFVSLRFKPLQHSHWSGFERRPFHSIIAVERFSFVQEKWLLSIRAVLQGPSNVQAEARETRNRW